MNVPFYVPIPREVFCRESSASECVDPDFGWESAKCCVMEIKLVKCTNPEC